MFAMYRVPLLLVSVALAAASQLPAAERGDAEKGKAMFQPCGVCHRTDSADKKIGPGLKGLFKKGKMSNGRKTTEAEIRAKIAAGGNGMPAYKDMLNGQETDSLIAYLKTL
jgi:cytochrome c